MAKKTVTKEVDVCDVCGVEAYPNKCLRCGLEVCYKCQEKVGVTYTHSFYCGSSDDGFYCNKCNEKLINGGNTLFNKYYEMNRYKKEYELYSKDLNEKVKVLRQEILALVDVLKK